jgi:hypothetical protein
MIDGLSSRRDGGAYVTPGDRVLFELAYWAGLRSGSAPPLGGVAASVLGHHDRTGGLVPETLMALAKDKDPVDGPEDREKEVADERLPNEHGALLSALDHAHRPCA